MLTMFDESTKSEVELKDIVDSQIMALSLHFLYNNNLVPLKRKNVHDILQLAIYLQIQSLQGICCKYLQVFHSSEIRGLRSMKCSSETLQNLPYFMYKKTRVV